MTAWIGIACVTVLVLGLWLALLAVMREVMLLRGEVKLFRELVQHPPAPSFVGGVAPPAMLDLFDGSLSKALPRHTIAFLAPGCAPCEELAGELVRRVADTQLSIDAVTVVVWASTEADAERMAERLPLHSIADEQGSLSRVCEVRSTPTVFVLTTEDQRVVDYTPEGSIEWILDRMNTDRISLSAPA